MSELRKSSDKEMEIACRVLEELLRKLRSSKQVSESVHYQALQAYKTECSTMEEAFCVAFINYIGGSK